MNMALNIVHEIFNPLNTGFYGNSTLNPGEEGNGTELSLLYHDDPDIRDFIDKNDITVEYDYTKYTQEVTKALNDHFLDKLNEIVLIDLDNTLQLDEFIIKKIDDELISPKYYNYGTDRAFMNVIFNKISYYKVIDYIYNELESQVKEYLKDHFTSCDGFISFYSNYIEDWKDKGYDLDCNELGTLFNILIKEHTDPEDLFYEIYDLATNTFYEIGYWYELYFDGSIIIDLDHMTPIPELQELQQVEA